jgi:hypothetical protein
MRGSFLAAAGGRRARIAHCRSPPHLECLPHPLKFRGRYRGPCWSLRGPDSPLYLEFRTVYRPLSDGDREMRETRIPLPCSRLIDTQTQTGTLAAGSCENPSDRCHTLRTGRLETGLDFRLRFSWPQFLPLISVVLHCTRVEGSCHLVIGRRIVIPAIDINWYLSISPSLKATQRRMKIK